MKRRKPSAKAKAVGPPKSLSDIQESALRKLAEAARPPTPEELAQLQPWNEWPHITVFRIADDIPQRDAKPAPPKRHAPKSEPAIAVLKGIWPLKDGRPSRQGVSDAELGRKYHEACDRRGIHKADRVSKTQLLRCAGRKKS